MAIFGKNPKTGFLNPFISLDFFEGGQDGQEDHGGRRLARVVMFGVLLGSNRRHPPQPPQPRGIGRTGGRFWGKGFRPQPLGHKPSRLCSDLQIKSIESPVRQQRRTGRYCLNFALMVWIEPPKYVLIGNDG
jgi:hypothetical protein